VNSSIFQVSGTLFTTVQIIINFQLLRKDEQPERNTQEQPGNLTNQFSDSTIQFLPSESICCSAYR